jgi:DNA helicase-2/ATP-dependent DNA helicase PcrA
MLLIRLLAAPAYDCFGVGDDDQVIYGYAGATPEFLVSYGQYFPGAGEHGLEVNYRCPAEVVAATRHLLSYNSRRVPKTITAAAPPLPDALHLRLKAAEELAAAATDQVRTWLGEGVALEDIAVLARVNSALLPVQVALGAAGIACDGPLTPAVLTRTGIRTALAYLRIGLDPGRIARADVMETVRRPSRGIAPKVTEMLTRSATTSVAGVDRLATRLSGRDVPKLEAYSADLTLVARACHTTTLAALRAIRLEVGLGDTMDTLDSSRRAADRSTHADDLVALESVAALHPEVASFEAWLRTALEARPADGPAVVLSTVHRMKGREWDRVIVFGASRGLFPHRLSDDEEEERRVFHVAITRARRQVVVVGDREAPSPFLAELDGSPPKRAPDSGEAAVRNARSAAVATPRAAAGGGSLPTALEQALRDWRRDTASRAGVPAYVVLNDQELIGVAGRRPATLAELSRCRGMGPIRLERYGDEILAIVEGAPEEGR